MQKGAQGSWIKASRASLLFACFVALTMCFFVYPAVSFGFEITIDVAPSVLNIQNQGEVVTVHTDIGYGEVDVSSVYLNGAPIQFAKIDNRGYFVAKFSMEEVKSLDGLKIDNYNELQLVGATRGGGAFAGSQEILVIDVQPAGKQ